MLPLLLCRFAQTTAAVVLGGTMVLRLLAWRTALEPAARWPRLAWVSWIVLLVAGASQLGLTAAAMGGESVAQACSSGALADVLAGTAFGEVWKVRAGLLAMMFIAGLGRRGGFARLSATLDGLGALLAAALLVTLVWSGHAGASDHRAWLRPVDALHAIAAGAWPGGLLPLALLLARTIREPTLTPAAIKITRRFSQLSLTAVGVLTLSGILNSIGLVRTFPAVWLSGYGRLVLCKLALLGAMIVLGGMNRRLLDRQQSAHSQAIVRRLWRRVIAETGLVLCVILATEALATSPPPG